MKVLQPLHRFFWSPEGRQVAAYRTADVKKARAQFKRDHKKSYGRYMGEVYVVTDMPILKVGDRVLVTDAVAGAGEATVVRIYETCWVAVVYPDGRRDIAYRPKVAKLEEK